MKTTKHILNLAPAQAGAICCAGLRTRLYAVAVGQFAPFNKEIQS